MQPMIQTDALSFSYPVEEGQRRTTALDNVTLSIEKGSFVVVLGHNGSGKSTLAKHMNAVLLPSGGAVYVEGMDTKKEELLLEIRRRVGMVFQNPDNQIVANVVEEDVAFAPENLGVPTAEIRRRVDDALAAVGMTEFTRHAPHLLSGGQKQRVAIAGVIAMEPECIVLDEATAMLDPLRPPGGAGHRSPAEPGAGHHRGAHHPPYVRGGGRRPGHRDERRRGGHGRRAPGNFLPGGGAAGPGPGGSGHGGAAAAAEPARHGSALDGDYG